MAVDVTEMKRGEIAALCRKHRLHALWIFGSATTDALDPESSDIDVLVDLGEYEPGVAKRYLDFADDLEALLGRSVDLVTTGGCATTIAFARSWNARGY